MISSETDEHRQYITRTAGHEVKIAGWISGVMGWIGGVVCTPDCVGFQNGGQKYTSALKFVYFRSDKFFVTQRIG